MLRMRHARAKVPPIFYLYVAAMLAMAVVAITRVTHI